MTAPFIDPIVYTGAPIEPRVGAWDHLDHPTTCAIGGEYVPEETPVRWNGTGWECQDHRMSPTWIRIYHPATCLIGGERIPMGDWARTAAHGEGWECREHANAGDGDMTQGAAA